MESGWIELQKNTFQLVVISDHSTYETYVQYNYRDLAWNPSAPNAIFTYAKFSPYWGPGYIFNRYSLSGTPQAFGMPSVIGNTGESLKSNSGILTLLFVTQLLVTDIVTVCDGYSWTKLRRCSMISYRTKG